MDTRSSNPTIGELVYTDHPSLPIMNILLNSLGPGYTHTGKCFHRNTFAIVLEVKINMGRLIFEDGRIGWCYLSYLESVK